MSPRSPRILAALDASEHSDEALLQADARARMTNAELVVCTVVPSVLQLNPFVPMAASAYDLGSLRASVEVDLRARVARLTRRDRDAVDVRVLEGVPHAALVDEAERSGADLLVVGSHGRTGLSRLVLGSVAERVMRYASCSVLVARPRPLNGNILVATDFSDPALPAIRAAVEEAKRIDGKLTAVHAIDFSSLDWVNMPIPTSPAGFAVPEAAVGEMRREARQRLIFAVSGFGGSCEALALEGDPTAAIVKTAKEIEAQLIVVGTAGRTGLRRVMLGSVAEGVVRHAETSVLIVRLRPDAAS